MQKNEDWIYGTTAAADYLGIHRRSIHRLIRKGLFPVPLEEVPVGENPEKSIKIWTKVVLDNYKPKLRPKGRPKASPPHPVILTLPDEE